MIGVFLLCWQIHTRWQTGVLVVCVLWLDGPSFPWCTGMMRSVGGGGECSSKQGCPWLGIGCQSANNTLHYHYQHTYLNQTARSLNEGAYGPIPSLCKLSYSPMFLFLTCRGMRGRAYEYTGKWDVKFVGITLVWFPPTQAFQGTPCLTAHIFQLSSVLWLYCVLTGVEGAFQILHSFLQTKSNPLKVHD